MSVSKLAGLSMNMGGHKLGTGNAKGKPKVKGRLGMWS